MIEVGQVVRVVPPGREAPVASSGSGRGVAPVIVGGGSTATTTFPCDSPGRNRNASAIRLQQPRRLLPREPMM